MHRLKAVEEATTNPSSIYFQYPFYLRGDENQNERNNDTTTRFADVAELHQFHQEHDIHLNRSSLYNMKISNVGVVSNDLQFGGLTPSMGLSEIASVGSIGENTSQFMMQKGFGNGNNINRNGNAMVDESGVVFGNGNFESWEDSGLEHNSQQTDTSTDVDNDDKIQSNGVQREAIVVADSINQSKGGIEDHKTIRRLAQNREAARKSRLRKKAYVQQLEHSRLKLSQLEQEFLRARQQVGISVASGLSTDHYHSIACTGALAFDMDYTRWLDEHQGLHNDLRSAVNSHRGDAELRLLVGGVMSHYDEIFKLKGVCAKADVFHVLSGMWKTPAERCFMWLGGFRSSEILKVIDSTTILGNDLEPLTDHQLVGICNLQQSSQQAEDALSQGMEALQQSLLEALSSNCLGPSSSGNVADYMGQMVLAMGKLATLENFVYQADLLRQQTLQQLHRILTTRQAARALLAISDYMSRLRALSSLWLARPKN